MKKLLLICFVSLSCSGCGVRARVEEMERHAKELIAQSEAAKQECLKKFPTEQQKTAIARTKCLNNAAMITRSLEYEGLRDVFDLRLASKAVIAEKWQRGQITQAEASLELAKVETGINEQLQQRELSIRTIETQERLTQAQERSAQAQEEAARPKKTTCTFNNFTQRETCITF